MPFGEWHSCASSDSPRAVCNVIANRTYLKNLRNGRTASLKSVLGLISADVAYEDPCVITLDEASEKNLASLKYFIEVDFPLCDEALPEVVNHNTVQLPRSLRVTDPDYLSGRPVFSGIARAVPKVLGSLTFAAELLALKAGCVEDEWKHLISGRDSLIRQMHSKIPHCSKIDGEVLQTHLAIAGDTELESQLKFAVFDQGSTAIQAISWVVSHLTNCWGLQVMPISVNVPLIYRMYVPSWQEKSTVMTQRPRLQN